MSYIRPVLCRIKGIPFEKGEALKVFNKISPYSPIEILFPISPTAHIGFLPRHIMFQKETIKEKYDIDISEYQIEGPPDGYKKDLFLPVERKEGEEEKIRSKLDMICSALENCIGINQNMCEILFIRGKGESDYCFIQFDDDTEIDIIVTIMNYMNSDTQTSKYTQTSGYTQTSKYTQTSGYTRKFVCTWQKHKNCTGWYYPPVLLPYQSKKYPPGIPMLIKCP